MAPVYKIAVIQLHPKPMQPEANFSKAAAFIARASLRGAHLAVLPEYHLTNWVPADPNFVGLCAQWETYLRRYQALAKEHNICIVPGTIVEWHQGARKEEDKLINVAYFIDNKGDILGTHVGRVEQA
ncbi:carbon-nitrogen hydrolase [Lasallia pustulata]|uniref:Carbon-nitrogen hydrolase n=1 Tax=Lasallia pustulata TaxID=136370 RepID=A0A1W5CXA5_9LECA|nr:carbon-nitrogen hydrolase [Lasallia pustulata]